MFIRHSLLNICRSKGKSFLFFLLTFVLALILCISYNMSAAVGAFISTSGERYDTIAVFEYMGADYPADPYGDPQLAKCAASFDIQPLMADESALLWDTDCQTLGYMGARSVKNPRAAYKNNAVLVLHPTGTIDGGMYMATISEVFYSYKSDIKDNFIYLDSGGIELEKNHYYIAHGEFYIGSSSYTYFRFTPYENSLGTQASIASLTRDITSPEGYELPADDEIYRDIAATYEVINNSVTIHATSDVKSLYPFHQKLLTLSTGEFFTPEEYESGADSIMISDSLAASLGVKVGDMIELSAAYSPGKRMEESYYAKTGFASSGEYKICGLFSSSDDMINEVYIPSSKDHDFSGNHYSYTLGQMKLENGSAEKFRAAAEGIMPDRVRLTIYDQGYGSAARSLEGISRISTVVSAVCSAAAVACAALFGYLFVYRQREVASAMFRMGAAKRGIYVYLLFGSGIIALASSICGGICAKMLSGICTELVELAAAASGDISSLYSASNMSQTAQFAFSSDIGAVPYIITCAAVILLSLSSCFAFAQTTLKLHPGKKQRVGASGARSTSLRGGALRWAWLSMKRSPMRTIICVVSAACAAVLFTSLTNASAAAKLSLDTLGEESEISGCFTDIKGQRIGGLAIPANAVCDITLSGDVKSIGISKSYNYFYPNVNSALEYIDNLTGYGTDTVKMKIDVGDGIIFTDDISKTPEFYYSGQFSAEFADGFDQTVFASEDGSEYNAVCSSAFLDKNGISLGDSFDIIICPGRKLVPVTLKVIGRYEKAGTADNIYCPLACIASKEKLENGDTYDYGSLMLSSVVFELENASRLEHFKRYLNDTGYSGVNMLRSVRCFVVLADELYVSSANSISQRIWYMDRAFPIIFALIAILALLIPKFAVGTRRYEAAIMKATGTPGGRIFLSFFCEQTALCGAGILSGACLCCIMKTVPGYVALALILAFFVIWLIGSALAIGTIMRARAADSLKGDE